MSRDVTSRYAVQVIVPGYRYSPACWNCRRDGRPTAANLARYVESFEASTRAGGCNAHLGETRVREACVRVNEYAGTVVATYRAPLFALVTS